MKSYIEYIDNACKTLDLWSGHGITASPTQLQSINLALVMVIADLIKVLEEKR